VKIPTPVSTNPVSTNPAYKIIAVRTLQASLLALALHWLGGWPLTGPHALGLFLTPALCAYFVFVFVAPWSWGLPILTRLRGEGSSAAVALTFDDGPTPETTPFVLDALRDGGVYATFFVLGEAVVRYPDLLRRVVAEGHAVGVHAYRHRPFVLLSDGEIAREIEETREAVRRACPAIMLSPWLRPPHGFKSPGVLWAVRRAGGHVAAWSLDARDYRRTEPARLRSRVLDAVRPGAIILLHDGPENAATADALPGLLRELRVRGLACVALPAPPRAA